MGSASSLPGLARPVADIDRLDACARALAADDFARCPPDEIPIVKGVLLATRYLAGEGSLPFGDPNDWPAASAEDVTRRADEALVLSRRLRGVGSEDVSLLVFSIASTLAYYLGLTDHAPLGGSRYRRQAA